MFTRTGVVQMCMALLISVSAATVFAASPHYKRGSPTCTINGTTVTCSGSIAGLGNEDLVISVNAAGTAQPFCSAPGNPANVVPGQNPVEFTATGSQLISADQIKNGTLTFSVAATATVPTPTAEQAGCPNPNWNVTISQATITSFTLTIEQPPGSVIGDLTFTGP